MKAFDLKTSRFGHLLLAVVVITTGSRPAAASDAGTGYCAHERFEAGTLAGTPRTTRGSLPAGKSTTAHATTGGSYNALVIFAKFSNEGGGDRAPSWASGLFDQSLPGSFVHFYDEMSKDQLRLGGRVLEARYASSGPASDYVATTAGAFGDFARFNLEIVDQADRDEDFGQFDNDGPDGVPNSGDDDGYVDVVFVNLLTVPEGFFIGTATGLASLGFDEDYVSDDVGAGGLPIRVRGRRSGFGGTTQRGHTFEIAASFMCHEFGHVLGLPDLFDQSSVSEGNDLDADLDSAGIGKWGLMGRGTLGWGVEDGPNAFSAWSLARLGWLGIDNGNLVEVTETMLGVELEDLDQGGSVYKIPVSQDEYFLLANRQPAGSFYDRNIPAGGLMIWHVSERADNDEERHKQVDLVCADGLFEDRGFPGDVPDAVSGRDNLDFWSRDAAYAAAHNGNEGDTTDPFDGEQFTRFAFDTNPALSAQIGFSQNLPLSMAVENIRQQDGRVVADILLRQPMSGHIVGDSTWAGEIFLDSDIIVEPGASLTLEAGTRILFEPHLDSAAHGYDPDRGELLVFGEVTFRDPTSVRFGSAAARPGDRDWNGIYLMNGQDPDLEGIVVENALRGLVRSRMPQGVTRWTDELSIPQDLVVPVGAELIVEAGTTVRFSSGDQSGGGRNPSLTELSVEGALTIEGKAGEEVTLKLASDAADSVWYGIHLTAGAQVQARSFLLEQAIAGFLGEVAASDRLSLEDAEFRRTAGGGLRLGIEGQVDVTRSRFLLNGAAGIVAGGSGVLRLVDSVVEENGLSGISLQDLSFEAVDLVVSDNGNLNSDDPGPGIVVAGGRDQKIEIWDSSIESNTGHGIDAAGWMGELELHGSTIARNKGDGLVVDGARRLVFENVSVTRNLGDGVVADAALVEIWTTEFADNIGSGLTLAAGITGAIEHGVFRNNRGVVLDRVENLLIRSCTFDNTPTAILSQSSSPSITNSVFQNNLTALSVEGLVIPIEVTGNSFTGNGTAVENRSTLAVVAQGNFWGTSDSTAISGLFTGDVRWDPFLPEDPTQTVILLEDSTTPHSVALHAAYPNPFNGKTTLRFDVPSTSPVQLALYDVLGRPVRVWTMHELAPGQYAQTWDGRDQDGRSAGTGVYVYRLRVGDTLRSGRLLLLR